MFAFVVMSIMVDAAIDPALATLAALAAEAAALVAALAALAAAALPDGSFPRGNHGNIPL